MGQGWLILWVFLWYRWPLWLLQSLFFCFRIPQASPNIWQWVGSLHLFWSIARWSLFDDSCPKHQSMSIIEYILISYYSIDFFFFLLVVDSILGLLTSRQCQRWLLLMSWVKLNQSLVGQFHSFWATFIPLHLISSTNCRSKILWLGWCPNPSIGSLSCLQEMFTYPQLLGVLARVIHTDSWEFPLSCVSRSSEGWPLPFQSSF